MFCSCFRVSRVLYVVFWAVFCFCAGCFFRVLFGVWCRVSRVFCGCFYRLIDTLNCYYEYFRMNCILVAYAPTY